MLIIPVVDRSNLSPIYIIAFGATAVECLSSTQTKKQTDTHILPGLESGGAGLLKG